MIVEQMLCLESLQIEELEQTIQELSTNVDREEFERLKKCMSLVSKKQPAKVISLSLSLSLSLSSPLFHIPLYLVYIQVSEMMTTEIESVREALANEKEERVKAELDAQEVYNHHPDT